MQDNETPLFCFGTLMDTDLMSCVTDTAVTSLHCVPATLEGYQQRCVKGENFPVITAAERSSVSGVLYFGLSHQALDRILFYEGDEYQLAPLIVIDDKGNPRPSEVFLDRGVYHTSDRKWDLEHWQQTEKTEFLIRVRNYMQYFGQLTTTQADKYW